MQSFVLSIMLSYEIDFGGRQFEIAFTQPMINYCVEREEGGPRRMVDLPDRLMSNFDKRA